MAEVQHSEAAAEVVPNRSGAEAEAKMTLPVPQSSVDVPEQQHSIVGSTGHICKEVSFIYHSHYLVSGNIRCVAPVRRVWISTAATVILAVLGSVVRSAGCRSTCRGRC